MGTNYYVRENECDCCKRYDEYHIGKRSGGWQFSFQSHPNFPSETSSWKGWQAYLAGKSIYNEYGDEVSLEELKQIVDRSRNEKHVHNEYTRAHGCFRFELDWDDPEGFSFTSQDFS